MYITKTYINKINLDGCMILGWNYGVADRTEKKISNNLFNKLKNIHTRISNIKEIKDLPFTWNVKIHKFTFVILHDSAINT